MTGPFEGPNDRRRGTPRGPGGPGQLPRRPGRVPPPPPYRAPRPIRRPWQAEPGGPGVGGPGAGGTGFGQHRGDLPGHRPPLPTPSPPPVRPRSSPQIPPDDSVTEVIRLDELGGLGEQDRHEDDLVADELDDDEFADDDFYDDDQDDSDTGAAAAPAERKRRRRTLGWLAACAVILLLAGGVWFGLDAMFGYDDYEGTGESDVLVQVADGDSTNAIGGKLTQAGVVASPKAFVKASEENSKVRSVQPGYYVLKTKMSGLSAVEQLIKPASRVGQFQLRPGTQLDDLKQPDGKITDGVLTLLMKASCANLNGGSTCVSVDELRKVAETADLVAMGVPEWAVAGANAADPKRRIEGLIAPGVYDIKPGWDAKTLLGEVLRVSATRLQTAGLPAKAGGMGMTPYQTLVIASLIEREAVQRDFDKVSRVVYNRLEKNMKLEFDSTVNYVLDRPLVRTTAEDRARAGAYNTYQNVGLPPTPIAAPSKEAIAAAEKPADGPWIFFVKCEKNGLSCFAETNEEHEQNIRDAQARGAY